MLAANGVMAQLLSKEKRLGNPDFWFVVLWLIVEDGEEDDFRDRAVARIEPFIREQMVFRLRHRRSAASLSGLTLYPSFVMGLEESLWYTIASNKMDIRPSRSKSTSGTSSG